MSDLADVLHWADDDPRWETWAELSDPGGSVAQMDGGEKTYWAWVEKRAAELCEELTDLLPGGYTAHFDLRPVHTAEADEPPIC